MRYKPYIYDVETYRNFFCCTLLSLNSDESKLYIIDDSRNDSLSLIKDVKNTYLLGYNNKTFDNIIINYIFKHHDCTCYDLHNLANEIIRLQNKGDNKEFYFTMRPYLNNDAYKSIDFMRMLFSKKLRVSLKELECSMNFKNVEELPYLPDTVLDTQQKSKIVEYNMNDCEATKKIVQKSENAIKLRVWTQKRFGVDVLSLDGVNLGVKILEKRLEEKIGNRDFIDKKTIRDKIELKSIIFPCIKFETREFNAILKKYQDTTLRRYFDKKKKKYVWTKFKLEPQIENYVFKYGLGGLHFDTKCRSWRSDDTAEVLSIDVNSYYPSEMEEYPEYCKPEHLPDEFMEVYSEVKVERLEAKASGDDIKNETYKLSINGAFGNLANEHSWLHDVRSLLAVTVNGQLMLSMLCEKLMKAKITLIDVNTDGIYVYLKKEQRLIFNEICSWWTKLTRMTLEETRFETMYFVTTADYFGEYYKKGKLDLKRKGCFITEPVLGKGMEFPIIYKSIMDFFIKKVPIEKTILNCKEILDFCSYKKLTKQYTCTWKGQKQQRVNRYYASRAGAHLYRTKYDEKNKRYQTDHVLKDSPVIIYNKFDGKDISERNIHYPFYLSKAREIITQLDGNQGQTSLF